MLDLTLAAVHHLLAFAIAAIIATELALVRHGMSEDAVRRVAAVDAWYGVAAGGILLAGAARAAFAAKGWAFYAPNPWFWAKMGAFLAVGLLSIAPTIRYLGWRRRLEADPPRPPPVAEITVARRFLVAQAVVFLFVPVFAAAMARYGVIAL